MSSVTFSPTSGVCIAVAAAVAVILTWRVIVSGADALREASGTPTKGIAAMALVGETSVTLLRKRLARNPADFGAMVALAQQLETDSQKDNALNVMRQALRLAPADQNTLTAAANLFLRTGEEATALTTLRRLVDLYPDASGQVWPIFVAGLAASRHRGFFNDVARENPAWWPGFFRFACEEGRLEGVETVFATRGVAGLTTVGERRCLIDRLQREGQWGAAYQSWLNSLPADQRQSVGFIFNGGFELPISNIGFDWRIPVQDGVVVTTESTQGAAGKRALHVTFVNKRYSSSPIYEHLQLFPAKYYFEGRGRADALDSWLGIQWGLYCHDADGIEARQLARSDPLLGTSDWVDFREEFVVPRDCPVQLLRLELANPKRDAKTAGNVAVRLRGSVWFDDLRVKAVD